MSEQSPELARAVERVWEAISAFHFEPFDEDAEGATGGDGCDQCEAFAPRLAAALRLAKAEGAWYALLPRRCAQKLIHVDYRQISTADGEVIDCPRAGCQKLATAKDELTAARAACEALWAT